MKNYNVCVVGATGAVGQQMLKCLEERNFPINNIKLLASKRSKGKKLYFKKELINVEVLDKDSFKGFDIALFSAGGNTSLEFAPYAAKSNCVVIDNSSAWRMDKEVPLIVPEVNPQAIDLRNKKNIIANPNCSTIQMLVALNPIHKEVGIKRIVVSTYQAVSGTGTKAIEELHNQTKDLLNFIEPKNKVYPHRIAFNCLPHIDVFEEDFDGYSKEEIKMLNETRKIFEDEEIGVTATTVRVPVFFSHSESINIETKKNIDVSQLKELLKKAQGVKVIDNPSKNKYPLPILAAGTDYTYVGRIRKDFSINNAFNLWVVSDNIRKGAATNAVQIAELLIGKPYNYYFDQRGEEHWKKFL